MEDRQNQVWKISMIAVLILLILGVGVGFFLTRNHEPEVVEEPVVEQEEIPEPEIPEEVEEKPAEPVKIYFDPVIDFETWQEENPDVYAWVQVEGTDVDYPVVQNEEDDYYLDRNLDLSKGYPGCIYSNQPNTKDLSDSVNVLYGHNMKNGSMFGSLKQFYDEEFFDEHKLITVYTPEKRLIYEIIAARRHNDLYLMYEYDNFSRTGLYDFVGMLNTPIEEKDMDVSHQRDMEFGMEDRYIILATCIKNEDSHRYLIIGKLIEEAFVRE